MVPVSLAAPCKAVVVGVGAFRVEQSTGSAVLRHAFAPQVGEVRPQRRDLGAMANDARLDDDAARSI
jgi:hypothetical protein